VIDEEVQVSRQRLESLLGRAVTTFSYPYGGVDDRVAQAVRNSGFTVAVTTEDAAVGVGCDPLRVPRIEVRPGSSGALSARLESLFAPTSGSDR
jgi:peptidoglycan/xylan/chitin deacetylase (PgdA/CDA1 family)